MRTVYQEISIFTIENFQFIPKKQKSWRSKLDFFIKEATIPQQGGKMKVNNMNILKFIVSIDESNILNVQSNGLNMSFKLQVDSLFLVN